MELAKSKSDFVGVAASGLCIIHCVVTPFLFIAQSCAVKKCCDMAPTWWSYLDYLFITITFFAVFWSAKKTTKPWMRFALYINWLILTLLVLNEKFNIFHLSEIWKYTSSFSLIAFHFYNVKYCGCSDESCSTR